MKLTPRMGKEEGNHIYDKDLIFNNSQLNVKFFCQVQHNVSVSLNFKISHLQVFYQPIPILKQTFCSKTGKNVRSWLDMLRFFLT